MRAPKSEHRREIAARFPVKNLTLLDAHE